MSIIWGHSFSNPAAADAEPLYPGGVRILGSNGTEEYAECDYLGDRWSFDPSRPNPESCHLYPHRPSFGEWLAKMAATVLIGFVVIATPVALFLLFRAGDSTSAAIESDRARKQAAGILADPVVVRSLSPVYDADAPSSAAVRCFETGFGEDGTDYLAGGTGR